MVSIVRLWSVPAVLLALYCPAVDNGLPCRLSFVPAVLLALYCRAVDNGPPWRVWFGSASSLLPCGWYWSAVASIVRLRFLLAFYRRAVVIGPPWRLSSAVRCPAGFLLPCVGIDLPFRLFSVYWSALVSFRRCVCRSFLPFC